MTQACSTDWACAAPTRHVPRWNATWSWQRRPRCLVADGTIGGPQPRGTFSRWSVARAPLWPQRSTSQGSLTPTRRSLTSTWSRSSATALRSSLPQRSVPAAPSAPVPAPPTRSRRPASGAAATWAAALGSWPRFSGSWGWSGSRALTCPPACLPRRKPRAALAWAMTAWCTVTFSSSSIPRRRASPSTCWWRPTSSSISATWSP
mmetsp:Transcript_40323/g.108997  ORF Transcript_40323/g.108997 Transcript_40323/m.108997 type:complete len:205 (-) Transcript_40323:414-1028(-)